MTFLTPSDDYVAGDTPRDSNNVGRQGKLMELAGCIDLDSAISVSIHPVPGRTWY